MIKCPLCGKDIDKITTVANKPPTLGRCPDGHEWVIKISLATIDIRSN